MEWLKGFFQSLPLDSISEEVAKVVFWWINLVKDIPDTELPLYTYVGMSLIVLVLWFIVAGILPRLLRGMSWVIVAAVLLTPGTSLGDSGEIAPAAIGVAHGFLMGDTPHAITAALPIVAVALAGFALIGIWQFLRAGIESYLQKHQKEKIIAQHTGEL
ncbi:MAG: resolvase [Moraxella sp.]|nr:resolvase [Moraxella sp.]